MKNASKAHVASGLLGTLLQVLATNSNAACVTDSDLDVVCTGEITTSYVNRDIDSATDVKSFTVAANARIVNSANAGIWFQRHAPLTIAIGAGAQVVTEGGGTGSRHAIDISGVIVSDFLNNGTLIGGTFVGTALQVDARATVGDMNFTNNGIIKTIIENKNRGPVSIYSHVDSAVTFTNTENGLIDGSSAIGSGIILSVGTNDLYNLGTIKGGRRGVYLRGGNDTLTNSGTVVVVNSTASDSVALVAGGGDDTVYNSGILRSLNAANGRLTVDLGIDNDTFEIQYGSQVYSDAAQTIAGIVSGGDGVDTLQFGGATTQIFDLNDVDVDYINFENLNVREGTISFSGSTSKGATVQNLATLEGTGTFGGLTFNSGSTAAPGNSIGTTNVNGDVTFDVGSVYQVEINGDGTGDFVSASGRAIINGGSVDIQPINSTFSYGTTTYTILTAAAGVTGAFESNSIADSYAFLTPVLRYSANDVFLDITQTAPFASAAITRNQLETAKVFDGALWATAASSSDKVSILSALAVLTPIKAQEAFDSISGADQVQNQKNMITFESNVSLGMVSDRISSKSNNGRNRFSAFTDVAPQKLSDQLNNKKMNKGLLLSHYGYGTNSSNAASNNASTSLGLGRDVNLWTRGYGQVSKAIQSSSTITTDTNTVGFLTGVDGQVQPGLIVGFAGGYANSLSNIDNSISVISSHTGRVLGYLAHQNGPWELNGALGFSRSNIDSKRTVTVGTYIATAKAGYQADQLFGSMQLGYTFSHNDLYTGLTYEIQPILGFNYAHLSTAAHSETGAGSLNLTTNVLNQFTSDAVAGVNIATEIESAGITWFSSFRAALTHSLGDLSSQKEISFEGGGSAISHSVGSDRNSLSLGAGFAVQLDDKRTVFADYAALLSVDNTRHSLSGGLKMQF